MDKDFLFKVCAKRKWPPPVFEVELSGVEFVATVKVNGICFPSEGTHQTVKAAEIAASKLAISALNLEEDARKFVKTMENPKAVLFKKVAKFHPPPDIQLNLIKKEDLYYTRISIDTVFSCVGPGMPRKKDSEMKAAEIALTVLERLQAEGNIFEEPSNEIEPLYKGRLQEIYQKAHKEFPEYTTVSTEAGFVSTVKIEHLQFTGDPQRKKKPAEQSAAKKALDHILSRRTSPETANKQTMEPNRAEPRHEIWGPLFKSELNILCSNLFNEHPQYEMIGPGSNGSHGFQFSVTVQGMQFLGTPGPAKWIASCNAAKAALEALHGLSLPFALTEERTVMIHRSRQAIERMKMETGNFSLSHGGELAEQRRYGNTAVGEIPAMADPENNAAEQLSNQRRVQRNLEGLTLAGDRSVAAENVDKNVPIIAGSEREGGIETGGKEANEINKGGTEAMRGGDKEIKGEEIGVDSGLVTLELRTGQKGESAMKGEEMGDEGRLEIVEASKGMRREGSVALVNGENVERNNDSEGSMERELAEVGGGKLPGNGGGVGEEGDWERTMESIEEGKEKSCALESAMEGREEEGNMAERVKGEPLDSKGCISSEDFAAKGIKVEASEEGRALEDKGEELGVVTGENAGAVSEISGQKRGREAAPELTAGGIGSAIKKPRDDSAGGVDSCISA